MNIKIEHTSWFKLDNKQIIELSIICNDSFWINIDLKEHYSHIINNDSVILIYNDIELIGFIWYSFTHNFIYLHSLIIKLKYQWLWITKTVIKKNILKYNNKYIWFKTNNSLLIHLFEKLNFKVFYWSKWFNKIKKLWLIKDFILMSGLNDINSDGKIKWDYINLFKDEKKNFMWNKVSKLDSFICLIEK